LEQPPLLLSILVVGLLLVQLGLRQFLHGSHPDPRRVQEVSNEKDL